MIKNEHKNSKNSITMVIRAYLGLPGLFVIVINTSLNFQHTFKHDGFCVSWHIFACVCVCVCVCLCIIIYIYILYVTEASE